MLAIALAAAAPGPAGAAPAPPTEMEVSSNKHVMVDGVFYPLNPYTSGGPQSLDKPYYVIKGKAAPEAEVTVTVTDKLNSPTVTATAIANKATDPDPGRWSTSLNVTNLGCHSNVACKANPASSVLTFTAVAKDSGGVSDPALIDVIKIAATPHDIAGPQVITLHQPTGNWCREHSCDSSSVYDTLADNGVVLVGRETPCQPLSGNEHVVSTWRTLFTGNASTSCSADQFLDGFIEDQTDGSFGFASEIADVRITVVRKRDGLLVKDYHPFFRRGTFAYFAVVLKIKDYENNEEYEWKVRGTDAWGNFSEDSGSFMVTP